MSTTTNLMSWVKAIESDNSELLEKTSSMFDKHLAGITNAAKNLISASNNAADPGKLRQEATHLLSDAEQYLIDNYAVA